MNKLSVNKFPALSYACDEAVNTLCTNLSFSGEDVKKIMLTSCHASEGKSFLSMNVARTLGKLGHTVALVDADLRKSSIASKYSLKFEDKENRQGLSHFLAGMATENEVIYETNLPGVYIVPVGRTVSNPLPLLNSKRMQDLLDHLAERVDYVLVDAPPIGTVIDAAQIAKSCDGSLMIVNYNSVRRKELTETKAQLEQTGCPILGAVLNMAEFDGYLGRKYYYKSYYYKYSYYGTESRKGLLDKIKGIFK